MASNPERLSASNAGLRERSGHVIDDRKLVSFLYELMRDHVPAGVVESVLAASVKPEPTHYCNGYLAQYAQDVAERLK